VNRPKRIAFLFRYGPTDHAELFHVKPQILSRLCEKYEVHYFGLNKLRFKPELFDPRVRFHLLPIHVNRGSHRDKFLKTAIWLLVLPWIGLRCRLLKMDLIYIDESVPLTGFITKMFSGRPLVMSVIDYFIEIYGESYPILQWIEKWVYRLEFWTWKRLAGIFVHAEAAKRYLVKNGVPADSIIVVRDPCEDTKYFPKDAGETRRKLGFTESDFVLVQHGILHPNKGIDWIFRSLQPLMAENPRLKLLVVGGGLELDNLKALARELRVEQQIVFTGWLASYREVNDCLNASNAGLVMRIGQFSDHFHTTGTLIHCLVCGLPTIAARLDGIAEVVKEGENGVLFDPQNADEFRSKLVLLMDDPALCKKLAEKGHATALEMFDPRAVVQRIISGLEEFLARSPTGR
jgi:glycosyltransferase involved in cell wall biosynthesis